MRKEQASSLEKALRMLSAFDQHRRCLRLVDLASFADLPPSTAHRLAAKLVQWGALEREGTRYRVGTRIFELGELTQVRSSLRETAAPFMEDLRAASKLTVNLAVLDGIEVLFVEKIKGHRPVRSLSRIGGRLPANCTALGKALLASADPGVVDAMLAGPMAMLTPYSILNRRVLRAELERIKEHGVAFEREEALVGVGCVAVPLLGSDGRNEAALSISGPHPGTSLEQHVPALRAAAAEIGKMMTGGAASDGYRHARGMMTRAGRLPAAAPFA